VIDHSRHSTVTEAIGHCSSASSFTEEFVA
jgi:hypothetical protein